MVHMAQPFSLPLSVVDGQGNWGSQDDPKSFAAMRYTEARLTRYAAVLLDELELGTVDWTPNFDGTLSEPTLLPAQLPNLLLNGTSGIAVGMATDVPPHNLKEVANALMQAARRARRDARHLDEARSRAPTSRPAARSCRRRDEIVQIYKTGGGTLRLRARYADRGRRDRRSRAAVPGLRREGARADRGADAAKKLPMMEDLRDESDHENPTRLVHRAAIGNRIDLDAADGAPVRDDRSRAHDPRQHQRDRPRRPAARSSA